MFLEPDFIKWSTNAWCTRVFSEPFSVSSLPSVWPMHSLSHRKHHDRKAQRLCKQLVSLHLEILFDSMLWQHLSHAKHHINIICFHLVSHFVFISFCSEHSIHQASSASSVTHTHRTCKLSEHTLLHYSSPLVFSLLIHLCSIYSKYCLS